MEKAEIIHEIETAFDDVPRPDDSNIVYDDSGYHLECAQVKRLLKDLRWQDIAKGARGQHGDNLAFVTIDAFWYFLPGYMIFCLQDPRGYVAIEDMEVALTPTTRKDGYEGHVNDRFLSLVTPKQSKAIFHFLQYLTAEYPIYFESDDLIYRALDFWEKFAAMNPISYRRIRQLLARQMGVDENKVTVRTRLGCDLRMDGADARKFLNDYCEEFSVDMTNFPYDAYFGSKPGFALVYLYYMLFDRGKLKRRELTVLDLVALTETKHWIPTSG